MRRSADDPASDAATVVRAIEIAMTTTEIRVPTLGESVTEATIAQWFKKQGETPYRSTSRWSSWRPTR
jgi:hypothetical protein